jgi:hypothetical protein
MFRMTADVKIEGFKAIKPSSLKWKRSIDNYTDTATVVVPARARLSDNDKIYNNVGTNEQIKEGAAIEIYTGYDGKNDLQFKGFVSRVNFKVPVEIECEGYSYQLKNKVINYRFGKTTVKKVLEYLVAGTTIKLSSKMSDTIKFEPVTFKNYTALQVLEFLKEKYLLTVCFFYDELYVGWRATYVGNVVKLRLNWNVADDGNLLFNNYTGSTVHMEVVSLDKTGGKKKVKSTNVLKPGDVKQVKTLIQDETDKAAAANDLQLKNNQHGYRGSVTAFLKPFIQPGDTIMLINKKYAERNGSYFCPGVDGSLSTAGGRQKADIDFKLSNG